MLKTLSEFIKLAHEETLDASTNDIALLDKLLGPENWEFHVSVETNNDLIVVNGDLSIQCDKPKEKKAKETDEESKEYSFVHVISGGAAVVRLSHPYQTAINKAIRQARHQALGRFGFTVTIDDEDTPSQPVAVVASPEPVATNSYSEDGFVCKECGKTLYSYISKNGKTIGVEMQKQMTLKSYQAVLCRECNGKKFAASKK